MHSLLMARVYPSSSPLPPPSNYVTSRREIFTVWMKSLIFNGNGCTVFDSDGQIVYRINNYSCKCSNRVYLMDLRGNVLITIRRKEGYKCNDPKIAVEEPWFKVRKPWNFLKGKSPCKVILGCWDKDQLNCHRIEAAAGKPSFWIVDHTGELVAEVKQKQSSSGVTLGDDVLSLVVEANTDHSFIKGLVVVYGLINHRM